MEIKEDELLANETMLREAKPETPDELHAYIKYFFGVDLIRGHTCEHHDSEFDYACYSFFNEEDCVLHSNRGGGKTEIGAIMTVLESIFKPPIQTRIIGGSKNQSEKMYAYTENKWDIPGFRKFLLHPPLRSKTVLRNGSNFSILSQSSKSVRGERVQRLRCDEVDEFEKKVWQAIQFCTRSADGIKGSLEIFSTVHRIDGVMNEVLKRAEESETKVFRYCLLDVLEPCGPERKCKSCALREDCRGVAKNKTEGFYPIRDAVQDKMRSDDETWQIEALCKKPGYSQRVFPPWDPSIHIIDYFYNPALPIYRGLDFGTARDPAHTLWIQVDSGGNTFVIDEIRRFNLAPSECVEAVKQHEETTGYKNAWGSFAEPAGSSYKAEFNKVGMFVISRMATVLDGIHLIRARLKKNEITGKPTLFISRRCPILIREIEEFSPERLVKGIFDHAISCLRYFFINMPRQIDIENVQVPFKTGEAKHSKRLDQFSMKNIEFCEKLSKKY